MQHLTTVVDWSDDWMFNGHKTKQNKNNKNKNTKNNNEKKPSKNNNELVPPLLLDEG